MGQIQLLMSLQGGEKSWSICPFSTAAAPPKGLHSFVLSSFLFILLTGPVICYLSGTVSSPWPRAPLSSHSKQGSVHFRSNLCAWTFIQFKGDITKRIT